MVFQILQTKKEVTEPMYKGVGLGYNLDDMQRYISARIFLQIKNTPELVSMIDTVVNDHFMGEIDYFGKDGKVLGSTNLKRAKEFWIENNMDDVWFGAGADLFVDGSCFPWYDAAKFNMTTKQKEVILSYDQNYGGYLANVAQAEIQEQLNKPRKVGYLAASTTEILHTESKIVGYKQETSGKIKIWSPDQVEHIKLMNFDGEVRGFCGMKALVKEIAMMFLLKENIIAALNNGGTPDNIIYLKNSTGISKAKFERLRTALESFSHLRKSHGNMPVDAEVGVIPLSTQLKDMEYRELAMFAVSEFCLAIGLPTSRVPFMMTGSGGTTNKGELSGTAEDAYQKKINNRRRKWENKWNKIFIKAGFSVKIRRDNLQDEVRETQAATQRTAFVQGVLGNLQKLNKQLSIQATLDLLSGTKKNVCIDDIEDYEMPEFMEQKFGQDMPDQNDTKPRESELKSRVSNDRMASKMRTASNNGVNA